MQSISILNLNSFIKFFILVNRWWFIIKVRSHINSVKKKFAEVLQIAFILKSWKINNQIVFIRLKTDGGNIAKLVFDIWTHLFVCVCSIGNYTYSDRSYFLVVSVLEKKLFIRCQVNAFAYKANALARKHNINFLKCADLVLIILDLLYSVAI